MLDTVNTKEDQVRNGFFQIGSGPIRVLLLGSCRILPYANYLIRLGQDHFTINVINVVNCWQDEAGRPTEGEKGAARFECSPKVMEMIRTTEWFLHEHTENFGLFNTGDLCEKNIYQFGMNARLDISLPNFHDVFILFQDIIDWNPNLKLMAKADIERTQQVSDTTQKAIAGMGFDQVAKFLENCRKTDLPEFADLFEKRWMRIRYFWTINHVSAAFTGAVFKLANDKFLNWAIPCDFWQAIAKEDLYDNHRTAITKYDVKQYGLTWKQPIETLRL